MEPVDISSRIMETAPLNEANTSEPSRRIPPENEYKLMEFKKPIMIQPKDNCRVFEQYSSMTYIREEDDSRFGILWSNKNENESGYLVDLESRTIQTIKKGKVNSIKNDANDSLMI